MVFKQHPSSTHQLSIQADGPHILNNLSSSLGPIPHTHFHCVPTAKLRSLPFSQPGHKMEGGTRTNEVQLILSGSFFRAQCTRAFSKSQNDLCIFLLFVFSPSIFFHFTSLPFLGSCHGAWRSFQAVLSGRNCNLRRFLGSLSDRSHQTDSPGEVLDFICM